MNAEDDQIGKTRMLRAIIAIIIRGGPIVVNTYQSTNPVMLKGMELPAEACYSFRDPTDRSSNFINHPVSIELFFGDNGREERDLSLGNFQLQEFLPPFRGSRNIELRLAVNSDQILSISLLDPIPQKSRSIGFIDISALDPPVIMPTPRVDSSEDIKNIFQNLLGVFENLPPRTGSPRRGKDLAQNLTISFEEALHGGSKDIEAVGTQTCPACTGSGTAPGRTLVSCSECQGTGWAKEKKGTSEGTTYQVATCKKCKGDGLINLYPCHVCRGNGWVRVKCPFTLHIPAYIDSGAVICLLYQGEPGQFGGLAGHLRVTVHVGAHAFLTRFGRSICVDLPVSANVARQGGRLRVPAPERGSSFLLGLPAGAQNYAVFRVLENEANSLTARIEIYRPALLFMLPTINQRIKAIREWLGGADIEAPAGSESDRDERISTLVAPAMAGLSSTQRRSTQQAEFYTRRGMIYAAKKDREHSLADFNMAIELDPEYAAAYDNRGAWYMGQKDSEKALADMNRAVELAPDNAEYYYHRAVLYHLHKDLVSALADYTKALELDPANANIYESRGKAYTTQNDLEAALADYTKALELDPARADYYHQRGVVYQHKNDLAKTIADFTRALELDPGNDSVRSDRTLVYIALNDLEHALADANTLAEKRPNDARAYNNRGYIYYLQKDFVRALADYDKALELDSKIVYVYNHRGNIYLKQNRYKQAIEDFDKSLLLNPGDSWLYLWLGQAYQGLAEKKKAIEYCQKVLQTSQNPELCQEAQKLLSDLGL